MPRPGYDHYIIFVTDCEHIDKVSVKVTPEGHHLYEYDWTCWVCEKPVTQMYDLPQGTTIQEWARRLPEAHQRRVFLKRLPADALTFFEALEKLGRDEVVKRLPPNVVQNLSLD